MIRFAIFVLGLLFVSFGWGAIAIAFELGSTVSFLGGIAVGISYSTVAVGVLYE